MVHQHLTLNLSKLVPLFYIADPVAIWLNIEIYDFPTKVYSTKNIINTVINYYNNTILMEATLTCIKSLQ